ncbi:hypothetical protein G4B88_028111 [Cannabis sativa]|uniref:Phytocyanin domain-containing protein n=1 Tax=Cannabis sativa TaxID=3483 RepID=A0A7J6HVK8_CANSA|nr:hypothetical protein G4B88_028111 [Cannabis sativa]
MARGLVGLICCFALTVVIFTDSTAAVTHTVGDTTGWTIPSSPEFYTDTWEDNKTFRVGDKLAFNWSGVHNVAQVSTEADYDNCNTAAARVLSSTSPFEFTLNTTGDHYFLCTVGTHCRSGQKLKVDVDTSTTTPTTPATPTTPGSPTNGTTTSSPTTPTTSTPANSSPSFAPLGALSAAMFALVLSSFL